MPNIRLHKKKRVSAFRKIALGTWKDAYDPSVYGYLTLEMDEAFRYIDAFRAHFGKHLTVTHMVARALAAALAACPDANGLIRWNRVYLREQVDISLQVVMAEDGKEDQADLSAVKIPNADKTSLLDMIELIEKRVEKIRKREDEELESTRQSMRWIPYAFMNSFMKLLSLLLYTFNLDLRWAGLPRDPFGSAFVTSIGSIGLEAAFVPLVPYSRVPLLVAPGLVRDEAVVRDGKLVPGKRMTVAATFDHRLLDGFHASVLSRTFRTWFERPFEHFDPLPAAAGAATPGA
jgi:pyruvate dehydrogenase E2 component (dihydrolipoamide acetyltransferase)